MSEFVYQPAPFVPFRDLEVIERCRNLTREELVTHPNPDLNIQILPSEEITFRWFADLINRIATTGAAGERCVLLLPNPWPGYRHVARIINAARNDCKHLGAFAMY